MSRHHPRLAGALRWIATGGLLTLLGVAVPAQAQPAFGFVSASAVQQATGPVVVQWTTEGSAPELTGFRVDRIENGTPTTVTTTPPTVTSATDLLAGLSTGVHLVGYEVTALAGTTPVDSITTYPPAIYKDVPSGPATVDITTAGTRVTLSWTPPTINAALLTGYRVERRVGASGPYTVLTPSTTARTYVDTIPGLPTGISTIYYRLVSLAGGNDGGVNEPVVEVFVGVPSYPTDPAARMGFDGNSAVITWGPPDQNADLVTGYRITRTIGGVEVPVGTVGADARRIVDTGLAPVPNGTAVTYTVTALAGSESGGQVPVFLTVDHQPLEMPAPRVTPGDRELVVTWDAPAGVSPAGYQVRYRVDSTGDWVVVPAGSVDAANRRAVISGLTNGVTYEVEVAAVDVPGAGQSAWSPPTPGTPQAVKPTESPKPTHSPGPKPTHSPGPKPTHGPGPKPTHWPGPRPTHSHSQLPVTGTDDLPTIGALGAVLFGGGSLLVMAAAVMGRRSARRARD
ncbi:fibronectin type III domain-containing protein [Micromonospora cathayae]|uniref:Fibronectin type III domain-containing protein n=1 Tax=Micromonospora cathayae TaxID=3028804 RepID=A0ABY7ZNN8_9ACTN|nr:fibronectin type III domain-containing protein [Micromonospora sp. HUAS 3]WDZ84391.1 fibronectin type III domain-containing protein [Micromonospora sp. HUAS 3]